MDTTVDENTPLISQAVNPLLCPATLTRGKKKTLPSVTSSPSSQFSTPRHRKTAGLTRQTEVSTHPSRWADLGRART